MIRAAGLRDLDTLESIERASFGPDAWTAVQIGDELHADRIVLAHVDEFGVQGFASIRVFAPDAELMRIAVGLGSRREGVGSRLLAAVEDAARNRGAERMLLEVASDNDSALTFYSKASYRETGRRRFYYKSGADALLLERDLR
ncbi:MAG TPA: GNAT family N-acetyltransferase [Aeromicrobium sp.]|nr:GNAT family N-acetyltransferase [Aeromicrobium sp.]